MSQGMLFGAMEAPVVEETEAEREALQGALLSIQRVMAADPRDWSLVERDAWLYAVLLGWDEALPEVATRHGWTSRVLTIIQRCRSIIESTMRKTATLDQRNP